MSAASDFAAALVVAQATRAAVPVPPQWAGTNLTAYVTPDGGCVVDRSATLTHDEAVALGSWLLSTFT
jgi:FAD/FMN-containing dehydrogenase